MRRIERSERRRNGAIPTIFSPESLLARLFLDSNLGGFLKFFRISLQNYQTKQPGCGRASEATTGGSGARVFERPTRTFLAGAPHGSGRWSGAATDDAPEQAKRPERSVRGGRAGWGHLCFARCASQARVCLSGILLWQDGEVCGVLMRHLCLARCASQARA